MSEPTAPMSAERIAEIAEIAAAATPGPWTLVRGIESDEIATGSSPEADSIAEAVAYRADAHFIAATRSAVPELLAEVERLQAHAEQLQAKYLAAAAEVAAQVQRATRRAREHGADREELWRLQARVSELESRPSRAEVLRQAAVTIRTDAGLREAEGDHGLAAEIRALADLIDPDEADTIDERRRCPQSCTDPQGTVYRCPKPSGHDTHGADDWSWTTCHHRATAGEGQ